MYLEIYASGCLKIQSDLNIQGNCIQYSKIQHYLGTSFGF